MDKETKNVKKKPPNGKLNGKELPSKYVLQIFKTLELNDFIAKNAQYNTNMQTNISREMIYKTEGYTQSLEIKILNQDARSPIRKFVINNNCNMACSLQEDGTNKELK